MGIIVNLNSGPTKAAARERKPSRNRVGHYLVVILGSGALAALLALLIAGIPTVLSVAFPATQQIQATQVFPSVSPVHQVVNVYDPPKYTAPPTSRPTQPPAVHSSPPPSDDGGHTPGGSPPPDD